MRSLVSAVLVATAATLVPSGLAPRAPAAAAAAVLYQPPVDGPVVDGFRPPASPFGPGNRGVDYATTPGSPVMAAGDGLVVFAGQVGGRLHVVVRHADGIRTSYSFLDAVTVHTGDRVSAGQEVGRAGHSLHFGARRGDAYIDPLGLFAPAREARVHLVPDDGGDDDGGGPGPGPTSPPVRARAVSRATVDWARRARPPAIGSGHG